MSLIERSIHMPYTCEQVFDLVSDITAYPQFVPYCLDTKITAAHNRVLEGTLRVGYKGLGYTFVTRNTNRPPEHIRMELLSGPFRRLEGEWLFKPDSQGCKVDLRLTIVFKNPLLAVMFKKKIDEVTDMMVSAFVQRARELYK